MGLRAACRTPSTEKIAYTDLHARGGNNFYKSQDKGEQRPYGKSKSLRGVPLK